MKKIGFTLAEIMIVLSVIAILTAILLPSARNAMPNKNVMKFKTGHNALYTVIAELVNSDKYYLNGDLGTKANGEELYEWNTKPEQQQFFCKTFSDVATTKYIDCAVLLDGTGGSITMGLLPCTGQYVQQKIDCNGTEITNEYLQDRKEAIDRGCRQKPFEYNINPKQIILTNDVWFYDFSPKTTFGVTFGAGERIFSPPNQSPPTFYDNHGMDVKYKIFCMDIDGVPQNATKDDCVNECPFGYGIRADGKILNGARADEWLEKSIQEK